MPLIPEGLTGFFNTYVLGFVKLSFFALAIFVIIDALVNDDLLLSAWGHLFSQFFPLSTLMSGDPAHRMTGWP